MLIQKKITIRTPGRGSIEITKELNNIISETGIRQGICNLLLMHTSASLMLCENADPSVRSDLETFMGRLAPDGDPEFRHVTEGPDDMAAHVRSVLTESNMSLPVNHGQCVLGTWQGIFLWEHRTRSHNRSLMVTIYGE